jgi:UDP-N-acetyl-D-galactosamine dehydrogenase
VTAGVYKAASIKVAEAAKVIENTQRDLNIALMNELSLIFNRMDIDTHSVLAAAGTKWNFLPFKPGLVGGHCIGVDPYYLTYKAQLLGYHPQVILAGRHINDGMGAYIANQTIKVLCKAKHNISNCTVTVLGLTFKENCPDLRNSKVIDIITELQSYGISIQVCDPEADTAHALAEYGVNLISLDNLQPAEAVIIAVAHKSFASFNSNDYLALLKHNPVVIDVKGLCDIAEFNAAGISLWRL